MQKSLKSRKPKAGLLLIASPRFKNLYGPKRGTYGERKDIAVKEIKATMGFMDLVDPGIVYEREDAQRAMDLFYNEKVEFYLCRIPELERGFRLDPVPPRLPGDPDDLLQRRQAEDDLRDHPRRG